MRLVRESLFISGGHEQRTLYALLELKCLFSGALLHRRQSWACGNSFSLRTGRSSSSHVFEAAKAEKNSEFRTLDSFEWSQGRSTSWPGGTGQISALNVNAYEGNDLEVDWVHWSDMSLTLHITEHCLILSSRADVRKSLAQNVYIYFASGSSQPSAMVFNHGGNAVTRTVFLAASSNYMRKFSMFALAESLEPYGRICCGIIAARQYNNPLYCRLTLDAGRLQHFSIRLVTYQFLLCRIFNTRSFRARSSAHSVHGCSRVCVLDRPVMTTQVTPSNLTSSIKKCKAMTNGRTNSDQRLT